MSHSPSPEAMVEGIPPLGGERWRPTKTAKAQPQRGWGGWVDKHRVDFCPFPTVVGQGGGVHTCTVSGTPGTRPPSSLWEQDNQPQAHTMLASLQPSPPPPGTTESTRGWAGRWTEDKEEANNCLSTDKGLPKGEGTHCTNQHQKCNLDWVYYSLATATPKLGYVSVTVVSDSEVAIAQLLKVPAKSVLSAQQKVWRGLV